MNKLEAFRKSIEFKPIIIINNLKNNKEIKEKIKGGRKNEHMA